VDPAIYLEELIVDPHTAKVKARKAAAAFGQSETSL
jgi:hypothetical protein